MFRSRRKPKQHSAKTKSPKTCYENVLLGWFCSQSDLLKGYLLTRYRGLVKTSASLCYLRVCSTQDFMCVLSLETFLYDVIRSTQIWSFPFYFDTVSIPEQQPDWVPAFEIIHIISMYLHFLPSVVRLLWVSLKWPKCSLTVTLLFTQVLNHTGESSLDDTFKVCTNGLYAL